MVGLSASPSSLLALEERPRPPLAAADRVGVGEHPRLVPARPRPAGRVGRSVVASTARAVGSRAARALRWVVPGMLLGAVGPLGPRVLVFPLELLAAPGRAAQRRSSGGPRRSTPSASGCSSSSSMVAILLARPSTVVPTRAARGGVRGARRCSALRNLAVASLVLLPAMARRASPASGRCRATHDRGRRGWWPRSPWPACVVLTAGPARPGRPRPATSYPVGAARLPRANGVDTREVRLAAPDIVGQPRRLRLRPGAADVLRRSLRHVPGRRHGGPRGPAHGRPGACGSDLDDFDIDLVTVRRARRRAQILGARSRLADAPTSTTSGCCSAGGVPSLGGSLGELLIASRWARTRREGRADGPPLSVSSARLSAPSMASPVELEGGRGLLAQELEGDDADDGDEGHEEGVLHEGGATLGVREAGPQPSGEELVGADHWMVCSLGGVCSRSPGGWLPVPRSIVTWPAALE